MRKTTTILFLLLILPVAISAQPPLQHTKVIKGVGSAACDQGSTEVHGFLARDFELELALTKSGIKFYYYRGTSGPSQGEGFTIVPLGHYGQMSIDHDAWDKELKIQSPNYFNALHNLPNDCT